MSNLKSLWYVALVELATKIYVARKYYSEYLCHQTEIFFNIQLRIIWHAKNSLVFVCIYLLTAWW